MFEKYHAVNVGNPGGGGEYIVQEGFGWTNGVILWTLKTFGPKLTAPRVCKKQRLNSHSSSSSSLQLNSFGAVLDTFVLRKRSYFIIFHFLVNITLLLKYH